MFLGRGGIRKRFGRSLKNWLNRMLAELESALDTVPPESPEVISLRRAPWMRFTGILGGRLRFWKDWVIGRIDVLEGLGFWED